MFKYPDKPNGQFEPYGMAHDIYQAFMKKSNFRYCFFLCLCIRFYVDVLFSCRMIKSIDGAWGTKLANGSFNGVVGML